MTAVWVTLIAACILTAGYYAGTETGFYRLNRVRLRFRLKKGAPGAKRLADLLRRPDEFVITTLVGNNLCVFLATFMCTRLYERTYPEGAEFYATWTLIGPIFFFGEVLQKEIFRRAADVLMYRAARMLTWSVRVFRPAVSVLKQIQRFWTVFMPESGAGLELQVGRQRLYHFFSESAEEGTLSTYQQVMAANIMKLEKLPVEHAMIPLQAAVSIRMDQTYEECCQLARSSAYRRFPVTDAQGKLVGVVNLLDVLAAGEEPFDMSRYLRQPTVFDRSANIIDVLHQLKRSRQPMGFVRNGDGDILGIVTIKDLVEEIVGELGEW